MHLIHIADTHLGLAAFNRLDPESGMNLRENQVYDNFLSAIDVIIREKLDVLIHAGDLFDQVKPKTRVYTTVFEALDRLHAGRHPAREHQVSGGKTEYIFYSIEYIMYSYWKHIPVLRLNHLPAHPNASGCNPSHY